MRFYEFGNPSNPLILLIHGLGLSWRQMLPLTDLLKSRYRVVVVALNGHIVDEHGTPEPSLFLSIDNEATEIINYIQLNHSAQVSLIYGISLGGAIAARIAEMNLLKINHLIVDAGPIHFRFPKLLVKFIAHYQALNCWCTCNLLRGFYSMIFKSHYFRTVMEGIWETYPSGGGQSILNAYKSVFAYNLEYLPESTTIEFWYGSNEKWLQRPVVEHLLKVRTDAKISIFEGMGHAQLLIDNPTEIAHRIEKHYTF